MKVAIIGGGASGIIAAISARKNGHETYIFEKNEKIGKKIYITGKGRCNITNSCDLSDFFDNIIRNKEFLYSSLYTFTNEDMINFLHSINLKTKIERGNRVFPVSDKSSDVINSLKKHLENLGVNILYNSNVKELLKAGDTFKLKIDEDYLEFDKVIVATGGLSYKTTGSTGDGYEFARHFGLKVTNLKPSLCPIIINENYVSSLEGVSLRNISLTLMEESKTLFTSIGELLFTNEGITGPLALTASSYIDPNKNYGITLDLKPGLDESQLEQRILKDFEKYKNKDIVNAIKDLTISKLVPIIIQKSGIAPDKKVNQITVNERKNLVLAFKNFTLSYKKLAGFEQAVITSGGVDVKEINPSTMESKKVKGLYFVGEVLDVDALTGGFNLQIAYSTGFLAGLSI